MRKNNFTNISCEFWFVKKSNDFKAQKERICRKFTESNFAGFLFSIDF